MSNSNEETVVPSLLLEGLALDISILHSLLKRHRCNHGRTLYYRRMDMTLKSIQRSNIFESISFMLDKFCPTVRSYQQELRTMKQKRERYEKRSRRKEEEQWTLSNNPEDRSSTTDPDENNAFDSIWKDLGQLIQCWTVDVEEIFSRIYHASKALFVEVSRGFFLPFCSVALSAMARIRSMLMEVGQLCLSHLYQIQNDLLDNTTTATREGRKIESKLKPKIHLEESQFCYYMGRFMDDETSDGMKLVSSMNSTKTPNVDQTLSMLGIHRPALDAIKKKQKAKSPKKNSKQNQSTPSYMTKESPDFLSVAETRIDTATNDHQDDSREESDKEKNETDPRPKNLKEIADKDESIVDPISNIFKSNKTSLDSNRAKNKEAKEEDDDGDGQQIDQPSKKKRKLNDNDTERSEKAKKKKKKNKKSKKKESTGDFFDELFS